MRNKNKPLAKVFHYDLYGKRDDKYNFLRENNLQSITWNELENREPEFFFVKKNFVQKSNYKIGFKINQLFNIYNTGIETGRDKFFIDSKKSVLHERINNVLNNLDNPQLIEKYNIKNNSNFRFFEHLAKSTYIEGKICKIMYRPFDVRFTYYDTELQRRPSFEASKHMMNSNIAIISCRQQSTFDFQHIYISNWLTERCSVSLQTKETGYFFPLYLYPDQETDEILSQQTRTPNLNMEIVNRISEELGLTFTNEKDVATSSTTNTTFAPIDILDYIYAVLHSPTYREKYKEFLKIDFPRVPYPKDKETFWKLVKLGGEIRELHLLESPKVNDSITAYPIDGDNKITRKLNKNDWEIIDEEKQLGRIWINDEQYFDNIPLIAWEFYIGGYQPAQKWLKDRRGRILSYEDIVHYQKIIVALFETDRLMKEIDLVGVE